MFQGIVKLYRWPLLGLSFVFAVGIVVGVILPNPIKLQIIQAASDKFATIISASPTTWQLSLNIFNNNVLAGTILALLGFTVALALLVVFGNGIIIGVFLVLLYRTDALLPGTFWGAIVSLLPHGIFELPAFFLSGAITIMITLKAIFHNHIEVTKTRSQVLYEGVGRFIIIVIPLFIMAAIVESYVSPKVGETVSGWLAQSASTPSIAVSLNMSDLAKAGCTPLTNTSSNQTNAVSSNNEMASVEATALFNEEFYQHLKTRKNLPFWETNFLCTNHGMVSVRAWKTSDWKVADAIDLTKDLYVISHIKYSQSSPTDAPDRSIRFTSRVAGDTVTKTWLMLYDETVEVTQSNFSLAIPQILLLPDLTTTN